MCINFTPRAHMYIGRTSSQEKQLSRALANFLGQRKVNILRTNTQEWGVKNIVEITFIHLENNVRMHCSLIRACTRGCIRITPVSRSF